MAGRRRALSIIDGANHVIDKGKERIDLNLRRGKELILHGTLFIEIREAVDLPDMDHIFGIPGLKLNKDDVTGWDGVTSGQVKGVWGVTAVRWSRQDLCREIPTELPRPHRHSHPNPQL